MAVAALLRSLASKMSRASSTYHRPACGLHEQGKADQFMVGMTAAALEAAAAGRPSLATKLARAPPPRLYRFLPERGLHSLNRSPNSPNSGASGSTPPERGLHSLNRSPNSGASGSTPPISEQEFRTAISKYRAGIAYVTLFGIITYMCGSVIPRLARLESILEARDKSKLNDTLAIEAKELLAGDVPTNVPEAQIMQGPGHGKQHVGETGRETRLKDLEDEITKLKIAMESPPFKKKV